MGLFYFCLVLDSICHTNNKHIVKGVLYMDKKSYEYKAIHFVLQPAMADYAVSYTHLTLPTKLPV